MKYAISIVANGAIDHLGTDPRHYATRGDALKAMYPNATVIGWTPGSDMTSFHLRGEDGTEFVAEVEDVRDGSEAALCEALGRKLDDRDFGKTASQIIQADDYRREKDRE